MSHDSVAGYALCWHDHGTKEPCRLKVGHAAVEVEHEAQRQLLTRLNIEWPPGEPFYSLIESEITKLRAVADAARLLQTNSDEAWLEFGLRPEDMPELDLHGDWPKLRAALARLDAQQS